MTTRKLGKVPADILRLCGLLEQKNVVFKDFLSATASLKDIILQHNLDAIGMMISRRHDYISSIDRIDHEIRRIREANPSYDAMMTPEIRKHIQSLTKTIENMINDTMQLNYACETTAENELNTLKNDLTGFGHSLKWFKGYRGKAVEPRFLDVKT
jgi:hypothetical protein